MAGSWQVVQDSSTTGFIQYSIGKTSVSYTAEFINNSTTNNHNYEVHFNGNLVISGTIAKASSSTKPTIVTRSYTSGNLEEGYTYSLSARKFLTNTLGLTIVNVTTDTTPIPDPVFTYFTYASPTLGKELPGQTIASTTDTTSIGTTVSGISSNQTPLGIVGFPPGMNLSPYTQSGITYFQLSGTPTQSGYFHFKLTATGPGGTTTSKIFSILVYKPVSWIDQTLSDGKVGVPYSDSVSALNATSYSISPAFNLATSGLSFNSVSGLIAGTPKETTSYTFVISARNGGDSISKSFTISFKSGGRRIEDGVSPYPTISNKKRYNSATSSWINLTIAKRYNAATSQWIDIAN